MNETMGGHRSSSGQRAIVLWILNAAQVAGVAELKEQLAHIVGIDDKLTTFLHIEVSPSAPRPAVGDGPFPVRVFVQDNRGEPEGEVILWIMKGYLSALEFAWYTETQPTDWPTTDRLRAEPQ
jgi:hypothetical protein